MATVRKIVSKNDLLPKKEPSYNIPFSTLNIPRVVDSCAVGS
jgi:hypothetical protein